LFLNSSLSNSLRQHRCDGENIPQSVILCYWRAACIHFNVTKIV
jgi:hypothetical protein